MSDRFNSGMIKRNHPDFYTCLAKDTVDCKCKSQVKNAKAAVAKLDKLDHPRNTAGLEKSLDLASGVRVMLRQNLSVANGLKYWP